MPGAMVQQQQGEGGADVAMHTNGEYHQAENVGILAAEAYFPNVVVSTAGHPNGILPWRPQFRAAGPQPGRSRPQ